MASALLEEGQEQDRRGLSPMQLLAIHDRGSLEDASSLIAKFGDDAVVEAATIADRYRDSGNLNLFCRWRQVERAIMLLQLEDIVGEVH